MGSSRASIQLDMGNTHGVVSHKTQHFASKSSLEKLMQYLRNFRSLCQENFPVWPFWSYSGYGDIYHQILSRLGLRPSFRGQLQGVPQDTLHTLFHAVMPGFLKQQQNNLSGCLQGTQSKGFPVLLHPHSLCTW